MNKDKKSILITGAAGKIGSTLAKKASEKNYDLVLTDICDEKLNFLRNELTKKYDNNVYSINCNLDSEIKISELLEKSISYVSKINNVVHCSYPKSKEWGSTLEELKEDSLKEDLFMQLGCSILLSKKIIEHFKNNEGGHLIFISSIQGVQSPKFFHYEGTNMHSPIEYSAIKSGTISITKWLAKFYKNSNIRVNCVSPGGILECQPKEFLNKYKDSCTNIGMLNAEHIVSTLMFLISTDSFAINGQNIVVDDGWTL